MARDPDSLETTTSDQQEDGGGPDESVEFTTGPSRAERTMPDARRTQPLWPWLVIVAIVVLAGVIYAVTS